MNKLFTTLVILIGVNAGASAQGHESPSGDVPLPFAATEETAGYAFRYSTPDDVYLQTMRDRYGLDAVVAGQSSSLSKVRAMTLWVHNRLDHNGHSYTAKTDPMAVLEDAILGKQVQCEEFGRVLAAALTAVGMPARPLFLKAADADTRGSAAGHVLTEVWLADYSKWAVVDSQWDVLPLLNKAPLNAVELQRAIARQTPGLTGETSTGAKIKFYYKWLQRYLYYFDTPLDNRYGIKTLPTSLMLTPVGAKKLTVFQRTTRLHGMRYTSSLSTFYANPLEVSEAKKTPATDN